MLCKRPNRQSEHSSEKCRRTHNSVYVNIVISRKSDATLAKFIFVTRNLLMKREDWVRFEFKYRIRKGK